MCQGAQPPWGAVAGSRAHQMTPSSLKLPLGHAVSCPYACHDSGQSTCARTQNFQGVSPPNLSLPRTRLTPVFWRPEGNFPGEMGLDCLCACQRDHWVPRKARGGQGGRVKEKEGLAEPPPAPGFVLTGSGWGRQGPHPGPPSRASEHSTQRTGGCEGVNTHRLQGRNAFLSQGLILRFSTSGHQSLATAQPKKCSCYAHPGGDILSSLARNLAGPELTLPVRATKVGA